MVTMPNVVLESRHARLEPLGPEHVEPLVGASSGARDTFAWTFVPDGREAMQQYVAEAVHARTEGRALPFAIVDPSDRRVVGSTRFAHVEHWAWPAGTSPSRARDVDAVEIGWTWLAEDVQRTPINTASKRLMLSFAFERWQVYRVTFVADARNARSRAAIQRIGGRFDGVLRSHFPAPDGSIRDSASYSILASEWPDVRDRLDARLRAAG